MVRRRISAAMLGAPIRSKTKESVFSMVRAVTFGAPREPQERNNLFLGTEQSLPRSTVAATLGPPKKPEERKDFVSGTALSLSAQPIPGKCTARAALRQ